MKLRVGGWGDEDQEVVINLNSQENSVKQDEEEKRGSSYEVFLEPDFSETDSSSEEKKLEGGGLINLLINNNNQAREN